MVNKKNTQIPNHLVDEIKKALESVSYGSIEIFVQNKVITQITVRNIHKTSVELDREDKTFPLKADIQRSAVKAR